MLEWQFWEGFWFNSPSPWLGQLPMGHFLHLSNCFRTPSNRVSTSSVKYLSQCLNIAAPTRNKINLCSNVKLFLLVVSTMDTDQSSTLQLIGSIWKWDLCIVLVCCCCFVGFLLSFSLSLQKIFSATPIIPVTFLWVLSSWFIVPKKPGTQIWTMYSSQGLTGTA